MNETISRTSPAARRRLLTAFLLNLAVVVMELWATYLSAVRNGSGLFQYYTEDSNLFALAACALCAFYQGRALKTGAALPAWVCILKYIAACCLTVTFVVVVCILAPSLEDAGQSGYRLMLLTDSMLYMHLLCPIAAFVSFVFLETQPLDRKHAFRYALIPTLLYAVVSIILNIARVLDGPYIFLRVYEQPVWLSCVWVAVILGGAGLIAWLLWRWNDKSARKREAETK